MRVLWALVAILLVSAPVSANRATMQWGSVGGWDIRIDRTMNNNCFVFASYEGGSFFRMGFNQNSDEIYMMISDDDWKSIRVGKRYDIQLQFDNETPWTGVATGTNLQGMKVLAFWKVGHAEFIKQFMERLVLKLYYDGAEILRLSLDNSRRAVQKLGQCQNAVNEYKRNQREGDPFAGDGDSEDEPPERDEAVPKEYSF